MKFELKLICIEDYMEDDQEGEVWTKGKSYRAFSEDFTSFEIETNFGTFGVIDNDHLLNLKDFPEYFKIDALPIPLNWFSDSLRDNIYRDVWKEHVIEDIFAYEEDEGIKLSEDDIEFVADKFVYEGDYDCNLSYWDNIDGIVRSNELYAQGMLNKMFS